jgi:hypothetical protein
MTPGNFATTRRNTNAWQKSRRAGQADIPGAGNRMDGACAEAERRAKAIKKNS